MPRSRVLARPRGRLLATAATVLVTLAATLVAGGPGATAVAGDAGAGDARAESVRGENASPNPRLARDRDGWRPAGGARVFERTRVAPHHGARFAARARHLSRVVRVTAPRARVPAGAATLVVGADVRAGRGTTTRVLATVRGAGGAALGTVTGPAYDTGPRAWRMLRATITVPRGARTLDTTVVVRRAGRWSPVLVTNHLVAATGTVDPPTDPPAPAPLDNSVTQPAIVAYGSPRAVTPYAAEGALVVAGRENFASAEMREVSAAGGTVLVYLDAVIDNDYGRYHALLNDASRCGPATSRWPGGWRANDYGHLNDFRPGSVVQDKLACVLRAIADENPHIGGFFADDLGSRSWFPGFDWEAFGAQNREAYRAGAIEASRTFRRVSDEHGLMFIVNGTWGGGTLARAGGGYPDASAHGNALADGTMAENHVADGYWGRAYPCSDQWARGSDVTRGVAFHFAVTRSESVRRDFAETGCYAFAATQQQYDTARVWGPFRRTGLPSRVTRR